MTHLVQFWSESQLLRNHLRICWPVRSFVCLVQKVSVVADTSDGCSRLHAWAGNALGRGGGKEAGARSGCSMWCQTAACAADVCTGARCILWSPSRIGFALQYRGTTLGSPRGGSSGPGTCKGSSTRGVAGGSPRRPGSRRSRRTRPCVSRGAPRTGPATPAILITLLPRPKLPDSTTRQEVKSGAKA